MTEDNRAGNLSQELITEIIELRRAKKLHARVMNELVDVLHKLFPDWVCISEIGQTAGGRNDAVLFECGGDSVCFELFATRSQVDRDLLLLHNSPAKRKIAILVDRQVDRDVADAFYRKQPQNPFPTIWVSDVLDKQRISYLRLKLIQFVIGDRMSEYISISRQLAQTAQERIFRSWQEDGIDVYSGDHSGGATFAGVMSLLVVRHLQALGLSLSECEGGARVVSESFDYIIRQILIGVPMYLVKNRKQYSLLDFVDYEAWQVGLVLNHEADYVTVLLNSLYEELRKMYTQPLPEPRDMAEMIRLTMQR